VTANKEGSFSPPPPDAPQEVTAAGSERPTAAQIALARSHEKDLPTFNPQPMTPAAIKALIGKEPEAVVLSARDLSRVATSSVKPVDHPLPSKLRRVTRPAVQTTAVEEVHEPSKIVLTDGDDQPPQASRENAETIVEEAHAAEGSIPYTMVRGEERTEEAMPAPLPPPLPHQKAASDSDSPSRGIPTAIADPNKKITGGFGVPGEGPADYFPLDGTELRAVVERLLSDVHDRIQDDLRFSIACTYPRVAARVEVIIEAYGQDKPTVIPRVAKAHDKTPLATAREHAQEVVFVVSEATVEMTESGESVTPPNRMRQQLGLEIPHKQAIETPSGGRMWVDRSS